MIVVHGTDDRIREAHRIGERLAELTGGGPRARGGGRGTRAARCATRCGSTTRSSGFAEAVRPAAGEAAAAALGSGRRPARAARGLYLSSPIGLGHARRDVAVGRTAEGETAPGPADQLAGLPGEPGSADVLEEAGERVHPASAWLANESAHIEAESARANTTCTLPGTPARSTGWRVNNFMVFQRRGSRKRWQGQPGGSATRPGTSTTSLHKNPVPSSGFSFVSEWLGGFVGYLLMPDLGEREAFLTADYNAEMLKSGRGYGGPRPEVFVGNPEDVVDTFGPGLPASVSGLEANFEFAGYVTGFEPPEEDEGAASGPRSGTAMTSPLARSPSGGRASGPRSCAGCWTPLRSPGGRVPELRFLVVTGPRIDPRCCRGGEGATCGATSRTCASGSPPANRHRPGRAHHLHGAHRGRRPFLYVPLRHHFEQNLHVRHRLERYGAGTHLPYEQLVDPDALCTELLATLGRPVTPAPVETDGAARAARLLADLL